MKMYRFSAPYDYHQAGAIVIMASSLSSARMKAKKWLENEIKDQYIYGPAGALDLDSGEEIDGPVYVDLGCDC
jgi:hypothetical protein